MNEKLEWGLIGHWPFTQSCDDVTGRDYRVKTHNVQLGVAGPGGSLPSAVEFNGQDSRIEVDDHPSLRLGKEDFSIAVWIRTDGLTDVVGDLVAKFDPDARKGLNLGVITNTGVTVTAQSNYRNLHFGIDDGKVENQWTDCGRPGRAVHIQSLAVIQGSLYAGTFEIGADESGHLWRYAGKGEWTDLGATPEGSNSVDSITEFEGKLYCGTGRYNPHGSCLGPALNATPGGLVYRVEPDGQWILCGQPGGEDAVPDETPSEGYETGKADEAVSLTVYRGRLYVTSHHRRGAFEYEGGQSWRYVGPNERLMSFTIYRDRLYTLVNGGPVYRYEGEGEWTYCGCPGQSTQTYGAVTYHGELYVGTWPEGEVLRYEGGETWTNLGRIGYEREVMALALYNGKVYLGTLPMANVWRMDRESFTFMGNLDNTPTVYLRRVWSMAVFQGKLFAGTLPSGHVLSLQAGRMASHDAALTPGWHHIAAVREHGLLKLFVDARLVSTSSSFNPEDFDVSNTQPLQIGFGNSQHFSGSMSDLRIYGRALPQEEVDSVYQMAAVD